jgi:hypothetical protein
MDLETRVGRLSELAEAGHRADWSALNARLKALQPGEVFIVTCPPGMKIPAFRSTLLTNGKRFHKASDWVFRTRTEGTRIHCYLAPKTMG